MLKYVFPASSNSLNTKSTKEPLPLVQFSNGNLKKFGNIHFDSYKNNEGRFETGKRKRIMVASTGKMQYTAQNFDERILNRSLSVYKIGVVNKETQEIKLYDADLFHFKPFLANEVKNDMDSQERNFREKIDDLTSTFGSKRKKRATEARLRYAPKEGQLQSIADSIDDSIVENMIKPQGPIKVETMNDTIPPQNKNASSVVEVYNLYDIISEEEYDALQSEENTFLSATYEDFKKWRDESIYCDFILHYMETKLRCLTTQTARLLCYINYMVCFVRLNFKDWKKKDPAPNVPEPYKGKLMSQFCLSSAQESGKITRTMPQKMKDKLIAYAMVLCLYIDNFTVDGSLLSKSFKTPLTRITSIAYALGCHVSNKKDGTFKAIQLKLPLYVHVESRFIRKKK